MGKHKEQHGKTRVGKFLKGLGSVADPILDLAGDLTGIDALNKISEAIVTDKELTEDQKKKAISLVNQDLMDMQHARESNVDIQRSQFSSWMAKNIPYVIDIFILAVWGAMTIFIIGKALKLVDKDDTTDFTVVLGIYSGVTGLATQIVSFHRGSSAGSKMKDFIKDNMK